MLQIWKSVTLLIGLNPKEREVKQKARQILPMIQVVSRTGSQLTLITIRLILYRSYGILYFIVNLKQR